MTSKSVLLQIAKQPTERKMFEMLAKILQGGLTRDEARRERREESTAPAKPQPFIFQYEPENEAFRFRMQFKRAMFLAMSHPHPAREILAQLEGTSEADSTAA